MNNNNIYSNLSKYLKSREWTFYKASTKYNIFSPPEALNFENDFRLYISNHFDKIDFESSIQKNIQTISQIYKDDYDDLCELIIGNKEILKFHIYDFAPKPTLSQFNPFINNIEKILTNITTFTITEKPFFDEPVEEAERYINLCKFINNEKGSLITKIELPNEEDIKEKNVFEKSINGHYINNKIIDIFKFINSDVLVDEFNEPTDEELLSKKNVININVNENIKSLYNSIDLNNIDLELNRIENPRLLNIKNLTQKKIKNLDNFNKIVKTKINKLLDTSINGKIIELVSRDINSNKNKIKLLATIKNIKSEVIVELNSIDYKRAIDAHASNKEVAISGVFDKSKAYYKVTSLTNFSIL